MKQCESCKHRTRTQSTQTEALMRCLLSQVEAEATTTRIHSKLTINSCWNWSATNGCWMMHMQDVIFCKHLMAYFKNHWKIQHLKPPFPSTFCSFMAVSSLERKRAWSASHLHSQQHLQENYRTPASKGSTRGTAGTCRGGACKQKRHKFHIEMCTQTNHDHNNRRFGSIICILSLQSSWFYLSTKQKQEVIDTSFKINPVSQHSFGHIGNPSWLKAHTHCQCNTLNTDDDDHITYVKHVKEHH